MVGMLTLRTKSFKMDKVKIRFWWKIFWHLCFLFAAIFFYKKGLLGNLLLVAVSMQFMLFFTEKTYGDW